MTKIIVDTNILYDFFVEEDLALKSEEVLFNNRIIVFRGVLYELFNMLKNNVSSEFAANTITYINNNEDFYIHETDEHLELEGIKIALYHKSQHIKKNLSLVDAVQIALSKKIGAIVYTRDERMTLFPGVIKPY